MNGTPGFQDVQSSTPQSPAYRFLHEQWRRFRTGAWHLLYTHDLITLFAGISTKREKVPDTFLDPVSGSHELRQSTWVRSFGP